MRMTALKAGLLVLSLTVSPALFAQQAGGDGAGESPYKSKCAGCHGQNGEGKMGPKLQGTALSEDDVVLTLSNGKEGKKAPHAKPISGLTDDQIKAIAHYVKSLK